MRSPEGLDLAAYDFGGDGPPLVVIHATGFHARAYEPLADLLRDSFHCYAFDLRGHGASEAPPDDDFDWHHFAEDAVAVVSSFGLERPFGFGHSCGGAVLLLAEQAHPGLWQGLYTFEPIVPPPGWTGPPGRDVSENPMAAGALRRRTNFPSRDAAFDNYASKPPLDVLTADALRAYVDYGFTDQPDGTVTLACRPQSEAATFVAATSSRVWDGLDSVTCPVVVACGERTDAFPPDHHRAVAARLPRGTNQLLRGVGHFGPMEHPEAVAAAIVAALDPRGR